MGDRTEGHLACLDTIFLPHGFETLLDDWVDHGWKMRNLLLVVLALHPLHDVKVAWPIHRNRVFVEQVWHEHEISAPQ